MELGSVSNFRKFPATVHLGDWSFFLVQTKKGGYRLFSNICPHAGSEVVDWGTTFMCPSHGWRFEQDGGECINGPMARMMAYEVTVKTDAFSPTFPLTDAHRVP